MKSIIRQSDKRAAFTIVELLTVMSIIIILIGLLVPALNRVRRYAKRVKQKAQFHSIDVAVELFSTEFDGYPGSSARDGLNQPYCGAMKLCEAMMGMDLLGFHPASLFKADATDGLGNLLYDKDPLSPADDPDAANLKARRGPYLPLDSANAYRIKNLYGAANIAPFDNEDLFVLCDVYTGVKHKETGKKIGMPILYYRANTSGTTCPHYEGATPTGELPTAGDTKGNIYNYLDNDELVQLGMPWNSYVHPMAFGGGTTSSGDPSDPMIFYDSEGRHDRIFNPKIMIEDGRPYKSDSYILISAGFDGEYGTPDDVFNFGD